MLLQAVVIVPRVNGYFLLSEAEVYRSYHGFKAFTKRRVRAVRGGEGFGVALVLLESQVDVDFGVPTLFLTDQQLNVIQEAFQRSDELTHKLLGHGWAVGPRPHMKVEDFV